MSNALVRQKMLAIRLAAKSSASTAAERATAEIDDGMDSLQSACGDAAGHWKGGSADEAIAALDDVMAWAKSLKADITGFKTNSPDGDTPDDPSAAEDTEASSKPRGKSLTEKGTRDSGQSVIDDLSSAVQGLTDLADTTGDPDYQDYAEQVDAIQGKVNDKVSSAGAAE